MHLPFTNNKSKSDLSLGSFSTMSPTSAANPLYQREGSGDLSYLKQPTVKTPRFSSKQLIMLIAGIGISCLLIGLGIGKAVFDPPIMTADDSERLPTDLAILNINSNLLVSVGTSVTVNGIVVWDGRRTSARGFYLQTKLGNTNPDLGASESIFVKCATGSSLCLAATIDEGFEVTVTGVVSSAADRSDTVVRPQITQNDIRQVVVNCNTPTISIVPNGPKFCAKVRLRRLTFPLPDNVDEALLPFLGMVLEVVEPKSNVLTVSNTDRLARFGEVGLSSDGLLPAPSMVADPGPLAQQVSIANAKKEIWLDDASFVTNERPTRFPLGGLEDNVQQSLRAGFVLPTSLLTGFVVLDRRNKAYKLQPSRFGMQRIPQGFVAPAGTDRLNGNTVVESKGVKKNNPTQAYLRIASMNLENFFVDPVRAGSCPVFDCRGAQTKEEYQIQSRKIYESIRQVLPAVIVAQEMENDAASLAIIQFCAELNAYIAQRNGGGANITSYTFVNSGRVGGDVTRPAIIFDSNLVDPVGAFKIFSYQGGGSRPSLLQTFTPKCSQDKFTVVAMHLKSRLPTGCENDADCESDSPFGEAAFSKKRAVHTAAIRDFINTDPTASGSNKFIVMGDFNANRKEKAVTIMTSGGFVDLASRDEKDLPHSFQFEGRFSTLDYALATPSMAAICTAAEWHTNSVESDLMGFKELGVEDSPFRSSDHDPLIVGCDFTGGCTAAPTAPATKSPTKAPTNPATPSTAKWKAFINEFHADSVGSDLQGEEFVEVAVSASALRTSLDKITVQLINGANGAPYFTTTLSTFTRGATVCAGNPNEETVLFFRNIASIQNGPDSIAVAFEATLEDHVSYPNLARFVPTAGIATGDFPTPVGLKTEVPSGNSVSRVGTGKASTYETSFVRWSAPVQATPGQVNIGQQFDCSTGR